MDEGEAKKDGERWMFSQLVVISRFIKNPEPYPSVSTSLKEKI